MDYAPLRCEDIHSTWDQNQKWGIQVKENEIKEGKKNKYSILSWNTNTVMESKNVKNHGISKCYMKLKNFE